MQRRIVWAGVLCLAAVLCCGVTSAVAADAVPSGTAKRMINPQPEPPGMPGPGSVSINPQPEPPGAAATPVPQGMPKPAVVLPKK